MDIETETIAQILVSTLAVALFIGGLVILTGEYGTTNADGGIQISPDGGLALVGFIGLFIVLMPVFGYLIERVKTNSE